MVFLLLRGHPGTVRGVPRHTGGEESKMWFPNALSVACSVVREAVCVEDGQFRGGDDRFGAYRRSWPRAGQGGISKQWILGVKAQKDCTSSLEVTTYPII